MGEKGKSMDQQLAKACQAGTKSDHLANGERSSNKSKQSANDETSGNGG